MSTPLSVLNLTIRAQYCLKRGRVYDVETLRAMEARDILSIPEVGKKTLQEINLALAEYESTTKPEGVGMNLREAAEMALEALMQKGEHYPKVYQAAEALRQALAQHVDAVNMTPERVDETVKGKHEPVGGEWVPCVKLPVIVHVRNQRDGENHISTREGITPVLPEDLIMRGVAGEEYPIGRELFERTYTFDTAPPKKEWVGLTDDELEDLEFASVDREYGHLDVRVLSQAIEAKLKEKNA